MTESTQCPDALRASSEAMLKIAKAFGGLESALAEQGWYEPAEEAKTTRLALERVSEVFEGEAIVKAYFSKKMVTVAASKV